MKALRHCESIGFYLISFYFIIPKLAYSQEYPFSVGYKHSCVGALDGDLECFGDNYYGQLGQGHDESIGDNPDELGPFYNSVDLGTDSELFLTAKQVSCGHFHTCVILNNNKGAKCWGWNRSGQLGLGIPATQHKGDNPNEMGNRLPLLNLDTGIIPSQITSGYHHTCIKFDNNKVKCFGY